MRCKIGVIWSSAISDTNFVVDDDVFLCHNVRMNQVKTVATQLIANGAEILVATAGTEAALRGHVAVPVIMALNSYIDILETLRDAENRFFPKQRRAALVLHAGNPIHPNRLQPFTKFELGYFRFSTEHPLEQVIPALYADGYRLLIGGPTAVSMTAQHDMDAELLSNHSQSLISAIQKAREILEYIHKERHQAESLQTVLNIIPEGIIVADSDGIVTMGNDQMAELLGVERSAMAGIKVTQLLEDESWKEIYRYGKIQNDRIVLHKKNRYFSTRRPIIENGKPVGAVGIMQAADKIQTMERKYRSLQSLGPRGQISFLDIYRGERCYEGGH